ncbi:MAG: DegT/DnrJ/EryC1/StrS family aminotransferase [Symbiobacteriia bacterium]
MAKVPSFDLTRQYQRLKTELDEAVGSVMASGNFILGPNEQAFEEELARYCGTRFAVGVASGTDALLLTLEALGVGPGDEVITSPFTFFASAEVVSRLGARPVFVDVDPVTLNMDPKAVEKALTPRTRGLIPVHIFGQMADMAPLLDLAARYKLFVLEDACQAIGSDYRGARAGSLGTAGAFSFFPTKNLGAFGDGGAMVTNDQELADRVRVLRVHGSRVKYQHEVLGYCSRLDELQAAVLRIKLRHLEEFIESRRRVAALYREALPADVVGLPAEAPWGRHVYHQFVVRLAERDRRQAQLMEAGIGTAVYYSLPLHLQPVYQDLGYHKGDLPMAEAACKEVLALPMFPELESDEVAYVAAQFRS